jgi:hypothetical protein
MSFFVAVAMLVEYTAILCIGIVCAYILYWLLHLCLSPRRRFFFLTLFIDRGITEGVYQGRTFFERLPEFIDRVHSGSQDEQRTTIRKEIYPHHEAVVRWVLDCMNVQDSDELPLDMRNLVYAGVIRSSEVTPVDRGFPVAKLDDEHYREQSTPKPPTRRPTRSESAILRLSRAIMDQRALLAERAGRSYRHLQMTTLLSIALGMITTITVAISTSDLFVGQAQQTIRLLAIAFPALGTAAAAAIAFYGPQATWAQATRTLASLSQLHGQMAIEIWALACPHDEAATEKMAAAFEGWSRRYLDIQTIANAAAQGSSQQAPAALSLDQPNKASDGKKGP